MGHCKVQVVTRPSRLELDVSIVLGCHLLRSISRTLYVSDGVYKMTVYL